MRTILLHLNVEAADDDERNADEIGDTVLAGIEVGLGGAPGDLASGNSLRADAGRLLITPALVEEVS